MTDTNEEFKQKQILTTHTLEHYKNHCEFLGYSVEEDGEYSIICTHQRRDRLRFILLNHGIGVMVQVWYMVPERASRDNLFLYSYANEINYIFTFMKICIRGIEDGKPFIMLTSVIEGAYDRKNFAIFLENINEDMNQFHAHPKTRDLYETND